MSKELQGIIKKNEKAIKAKGAVSEGQLITFEQALEMPTRTEAIGRILQLLLSPASRLVGQILGPGSQIVGQIKSLGEKKEETPEQAPVP